MKYILTALAIGAAALAAPAHADQVLDADIAALAKSWDHANFEIAQKDAKIAAFQRIESQAQALEKQFPSQAEPLVWEAITLSSEGGVVGGLGALGKVTDARKLLESAEKINANALGDGSIYTSLGSLYYQVPGFPIGFGNKDRARQYLLRALAVNPAGIEPNYFMGDFLIQQGDYKHAAEALKRALAAPARPGREVADQGRRRDAAALLAKAEQHLQ